MSETAFSDHRLYLLLGVEAAASLAVAYTFTAMAGFYTFTTLFLATVVLTALGNRSTLDASMNVTPGRIGTWIVFMLSSGLLTSVLTNTLDFPLAGSLATSVLIMLYVYWTHYSLEPQRA